MDARVTTLSIGEAAEATGLSIKTIRYYEQIGLIPKAARTNGGSHTGGHRIYCEADLDQLRFIHRARLLGLGLGDIRELLAVADKGCPSRQPEYTEILGRHLREIDRRIRHLRDLRSAIGALVLRIEQVESDEKCSSSTCTCMPAMEE